jgi:hypothetical protein
MQAIRLPPEKTGSPGSFCSGSRVGCEAQGRHPTSAPSHELAVSLTSLGRDLGATEKSGVLIHAQPRRFDVAAERSARLEGTPFRGKDISFHSALDGYRSGMNLTANAGVLADSQLAGGGNSTLNFAVDD